MTFKKTLLAAAMLTAVAAPAFAADQAWHSYRFWDWDGAYVSAKGGFNFQQDNSAGGVGFDYDTGHIYNAAIGYQAAPGIRAEFEVGNQRADLSSPAGSGTSDAFTLMGNAYYDLNLQKLGLTNNTYANMFTPYIGVGAGAARVNFDDYVVQGATTRGWEFAYQGMAGAAINFTPNVSVTLEYRYFDTTNRDSLDVTSNNVLAGVKFKY